MDRIDVEILWALKKDTGHYATISEIIKRNDRLTINKEVREKLLFLSDEKLIEQVPIPSIGTGYRIKSKGNDLVWKGDVDLQIIRLLYYTNKCTGEEIEHFLDFEKDVIWKAIGDLRTERKLIRRKDEVDGKKFWVLTDDKGKDVARNLCECRDILKGEEKGRERALFESMSKITISNPTKEKGHGLLDKAWKKIVAIIVTIGGVTGAIISILELWDRIVHLFQ